MIFIFYMFNQNEYLYHSIDNIQSFIIYEKLYHLQRLLQHSFIYVSLFIQIYLYNSQTAIKYQFININELLYKHILLQFTKIFYECNNSFINIYHLIKKVLNQHQQKSVQFIILSQMYLIMKTKFDECCINLFTVNKMAVILPDEYNQLCFYNIVICFYHIKNIQYNFSYIHFSYTVYMLFQYSLFFYIII